MCPPPYLTCAFPLGKAGPTLPWIFEWQFKHALAYILFDGAPPENV